MSARSAKDTASAMENLERNGKRLSDVTDELKELTSLLGALEDTVSRSQATVEKSQLELNSLSEKVQKIILLSFYKSRII